jgi:hypothetical protein
MSCLDNIIGIKAPCSPDTSPLSGYFITDYPGITLQSAANTADEKTLTGYNYLVDLRARAMKRLNNDLLAYVNSEYRVDGFVTNSFKSGEYNSPLTLLAAGTAGQRRGVVIASLKTWCRFYKIVVNNVRVYSNSDDDVAIHIVDVGAGVTYTPTVTLEAGVTKQFEINKVITGHEVQITIPSNVEVYSNKPDCGCGGRAKNTYLSFNGITNSTVVATEGYGIEADVTLKCDISTLICDMATDGILGQAAYELCGAMFYDEMTKNNRMNYLTIYKSDEIKDQAKAGFESYKYYMDNAMLGLRNYLVKSDGNCGCIECGGMEVKANV